jgi:hypothetical protein
MAAKVDVIAAYQDAVYSSVSRNVVWAWRSVWVAVIGIELVPALGPLVPTIDIVARRMFQTAS